MANGNNHAKKILIDDLNSSVKKLENGSAGDITVIGEAVCKQGKILAAMYENNFRTTEDCDAVHSKIKTGKSAKIKVGPASFEIPITPALISILPTLVSCGTCIVLLGKIQNWW